MSTALVWADAERDVVLVEGDDAQSFLHSQLAQDVASLGIGESRHSLLLEPTGHVTALLRVVRHDATTFSLDVDSGHGQSLIDRLKRFILRSKVTMRMSDWKVRAFRGDGVAARLGSQPGTAVCGWGSDDAIDVIAEASRLPTIGEATEAAHIDVMRVDARWPRLGVDILVGDIPATTGIVAAAVSFTKGCYPGQELVERMDSRGASAPVVLRILDRKGLGAGSRVEIDGRTVGTVTSVGMRHAIARVDRNSDVGEPLG